MLDQWKTDCQKERIFNHFGNVYSNEPRNFDIMHETHVPPIRKERRKIEHRPQPSKSRLFNGISVRNLRCQPDDFISARIRLYSSVGDSFIPSDEASAERRGKE